MSDGGAALDLDATTMKVLLVGFLTIAIVSPTLADDVATKDAANNEPAAIEPAAIEPAAWGSDHVGQTFPEYMTGDECLFCHRKIGPTWDTNPHQRTFQPATPDAAAINALQQNSPELAQETKLLLGAQRMTRFLRRSQQYGKLDLLSAKYRPPSETFAGELLDSDPIDWNPTKFADHCAGCHTTAVDSQAKTFSTISLDCVTCHGLVELDHTDDVSKVLLSTKSLDPKQVTSICGQCHLRGGTSKSTQLPYPNTFVPGDNLFRDFQVDFSDDFVGRLPVAQQHVYLNVRDVVLRGQHSLTCVSCHQIHDGTSQKHQELTDSALCASCHKPGTDNNELLESFKLQRGQRPGNQTCEY